MTKRITPDEALVALAASEDGVFLLDDERIDFTSWVIFWGPTGGEASG